MAALDAIKLSVGAIYFIGGCLLLPGFRWIIPDKVADIKVPVHFDPVTHKPDHFITVPNVPFFGEKYGDGVWILILGMGFVVTGAVVDLVFVHLAAPMMAKSQGPGAREVQHHPQGAMAVLRLVGPICQVFGAATILWGCVVFLPKNQGLFWNGQADQKAGGPVDMFGMKANDFGNLLFKIGSVIYFVGAIAAIAGISAAIPAKKARGKSATTLYLNLPAFCLFATTSTLYFINGCMGPASAVQAGWLRMIGTICLFLAVVILCVTTVMDVTESSSKPLSHSDSESREQPISGPRAQQVSLQREPAV